MKRFLLAISLLAISLLVGGIAPASAVGGGVPAVPADGITQVQYYYPAPGYYRPPPAYYPAPRYYAPPPVTYSAPPDRDLNRAYDPTRDGPLGVPTQRSAVPYSYMCYAGNYTCQLPAAGPVGSGCTCPGLGAPSYGSIR